MFKRLHFKTEVKKKNRTIYKYIICVYPAKSRGRLMQMVSAAHPGSEVKGSCEGGNSGRATFCATEKFCPYKIFR